MPQSVSNRWSCGRASSVACLLAAALSAAKSYIGEASNAFCSLQGHSTHINHESRVHTVIQQFTTAPDYRLLKLHNLLHREGLLMRELI